VPATARIRQHGDQRDRWGRYRLRFALGADATRLSKLRAESSRAPAALLTSRRPITGPQASTLVAGPLLGALSSSITGSSRSPISPRAFASYRRPVSAWRRPTSGRSTRVRFGAKGEETVNFSIGSTLCRCGRKCGRAGRISSRNN
jgi:hypothetical protein